MHGRSNVTHEGAQASVLFVVLAGGLGGSTRSVATVLAHLDAVDVRRVLATQPRGRFIGFVRERRLIDAFVPLPVARGGRFRRLSRVQAAWRIGSWLRANRSISAIHVNGPEELNVVLPAARLFRIPVVMWSHAREVSPWMRRLSRLWPLFLRGVRFAAVSPLARQVLVDARLARTDEVEIIPNPIDPDDVVGEHVAHDGAVVGYLGSDAAYKGFSLLPGIIREVADLPVRWLVFADQHPGSDPDVWDELRRLGPNGVRVLGKVGDVRDAYGHCDIVLCPSLQESFCRVAAEAMLNGLPVVASDLGPIRDLLGEEDAGLLFPVGDIHAAAKAVRRLVDDPELRATLGANGHDRAVAFDPATVTSRLSVLYRLERREG